MNALVMNCSPVKNGATAEIVHIVSECLKDKYNVTRRQNAFSTMMMLIRLLSIMNGRI